MKERQLFYWLVQLLLVFMVWGNVHAATLFERSMKILQERQQQYSRDSYSFVVLGDSRDNDAVFKKILLKAKAYRPLFILHLGDYSDKGTDQETDHFLSLFNETTPDVPLFVVMGNHENGRVFQGKIGPRTFTLENSRLGLKVISLDNAGYELKNTQLDYLRGQLAREEPNTFLAMHIPPETKAWNWHTFSKGAPELEKIISTSTIDGVFYAHVHLYAREDTGGIPRIITGGAGAPLVKLFFPGDPVYHFLVVRVNKGKTTIEMVKVEE